MMCLLFLLAIIAACRPGGNDVVLPSATPSATPLSTALPEIATLVPAGLPANPLQMLIHPVSSTMLVMVEVTEEPESATTTSATSAITEEESVLEEAILNASSVTVDIVPVERPAEALAALCASAEKVSAVWVEGVALSAALAQNCGEPIFVVRREINDEMQTGEAGVIVLNAELGSVQMTTLREKVFCRISLNDFYSWLLPSMVFRINLINPADFESIVEYEDLDALVAAVASGDCAGAGLSQVDYERMIADDEGLEDSLELVYTSPQIPYPVLMYPVEMQLGIRISLTDGLEELAQSDSADLLRPFLGQDDLERVDLDDFEDYVAFLEQVGLDFSILGN